MGRLTLEDLIDQVEAYCDIPRDAAEKAVKSIFWTIIKALHEKDQVRINGFGIFEPLQREGTHRYFHRLSGEVRETRKNKWRVRFRAGIPVMRALNPTEYVK